MERSDLELVLAVQAQGSLAKAAQALRLTPPVVTKRLAALEAQLGVVLFRRTQHGMALTSAGEDYARQVAQRLDALERDAVELMGRRGQGDSLTLTGAGWSPHGDLQVGAEHYAVYVNQNAQLLVNDKVQVQWGGLL